MPGTRHTAHRHMSPLTARGFTRKGVAHTHPAGQCSNTRAGGRGKPDQCQRLEAAPVLRQPSLKETGYAVSDWCPGVSEPRGNGAFQAVSRSD